MPHELCLCFMNATTLSNFLFFSLFSSFSLGSLNPRMHSAIVHSIFCLFFLSKLLYHFPLSLLDRLILHDIELNSFFFVILSGLLTTCD